MAIGYWLMVNTIRWTIIMEVLVITAVSGPYTTTLQAEERQASTQHQVAAAVEVDLRELSTLPPAEQLRFVIAALRRRESRMQNFVCVVEAASGAVNMETGKRQGQPSNARYEVRRLRQKYLWRRLRRDDRGQHVEDGAGKWDGRVYRQIDHSDPAQHAATIESHESLAILKIKYNVILGFRAYGKFGKSPDAPGEKRDLPASLVDVIEFAMTRMQYSCDVTVEGEDDDDNPSVQVRLMSDDRSYTYWLDPKRDFMPRQYMFLYSHDAGHHSEHHNALSSKNVDGLWVPDRVIVRENSSDDPGVEVMSSYWIRRLVRNEVTETDLTLSFAEGSQVWDAIAKIKYRVTKDGTAQPLPFPDPTTGEQTTASPNDLASALAANPIDDAPTSNR